MYTIQRCCGKAANMYVMTKQLKTPRVKFISEKPSLTRFLDSFSTSFNTFRMASDEPWRKCWLGDFSMSGGSGWIMACTVSLTSVLMAPALSRTLLRFSKVLGRCWTDRWTLVERNVESATFLISQQSHTLQQTSFLTTKLLIARPIRKNNFSELPSINQNRCQVHAF